MGQCSSSVDCRADDCRRGSRPGTGLDEFEAEDRAQRSADALPEEFASALAKAVAELKAKAPEAPLEEPKTVQKLSFKSESKSVQTEPTPPPVEELREEFFVAENEPWEAVEDASGPVMTPDASDTFEPWAEAAQDAQVISAEASATATAVPEGPQAAPVDVLGPIDEMEASLDMGIVPEPVEEPGVAEGKPLAGPGDGDLPGDAAEAPLAEIVDPLPEAEKRPEAPVEPKEKRRGSLKGAKRAAELVEALEHPPEAWKAKAAKDAAEVEPTPLQVSFTPQDPGDAAALIASWEGIWLNSEMPVAILKDAQLWRKDSPKPLAMRPKPGLQVEVDGRTASLSAGPPARMDWSDGSTWAREELQGLWKSSAKKYTVTIRGWQVLWDALAAPTPLAPTQIYPQSSVTMRLDSGYSGVYEPGPPAKLRWSDGEVWTRTGFES